MINEGNEGDSAGSKINQLLQQLAVEAQQHLPQSYQRQLALTRLVNTILQSEQLSHPQKGAWLPNLYKDFYNEALQKTLLEICQKIDNYNQEHPVMAWINFHLRIKFINVVNDYQRKGITKIPQSERKQISYLPSLDNLDQYLCVEETLSDALILRQFLEDDPENLLKNEQIQNRPEVNFQLIARAKFVEDQTWEEIASSVGVSAQTLCSFFSRRLQKLMPYFKKYLQD